MKTIRLKFFSALALLLSALVFYLAPAQFPVVLHKFALVILAAVLGFWLDRHLFPYGNPRDLLYGEANAFNSACQRRAIIVGATMLAVALAL